jgi:hypothetical protein
MLKIGSIAVEELSEPATDASSERRPIVLTTAELAECTCPEFCERDHDVD